MSTAATDVPAARSAGPEFQYVKTTAIVPSKTNPRKTFDPAYIGELALSMRDKGVLEPILVRPNGDDGFELVAGECRWRAAKVAGLEEMPVRIRPFTDQEVLEVQVIENLQRRDLHPLEEADGYRQLLATKKYDAARIAERIGMSPKYVYDRIKLLDLVPEGKALFLEGTIQAGHAILLARIPPADQKRAITTHGALLETEGLIWDPEDEGRGRNRDARKARSVRELDAWISEHVRFDPKRDADPMLFPETALALKTAEEKKAKVITITHDHFIQESARSDGDRTYGPQSWKRADGRKKSKACEHAVLGVIAAGPGRGEAFDVCTAKEKCKTHWAQWQRDREKRATGGTPSSGPGSVGGRVQKEQERYKREEEKRRKEAAEYDAFKARFKKAAPAIAKAFAERIRKMPTNAASLLGQFLTEKLTHRQGPLVAAAGKHVAAGKTADDLVRFLVFLDLYGDITDDWGGPRNIPPLAKTFGIDFKRLLDEVAPAAKAAPVATCRSCGCTEARACSGGCAWLEEPDKKRGLGLCTAPKCAAKRKDAKPAKPSTKKRQAAAARA